MKEIELKDGRMDGRKEARKERRKEGRKDDKAEQRKIRTRKKNQVKRGGIKKIQKGKKQGK